MTEYHLIYHDETLESVIIGVYATIAKANTIRTRRINDVAIGKKFKRSFGVNYTIHNLTVSEWKA
jgi:hypothetical protein